MIDKIVDAINEILGGEQEPSSDEQAKDSSGKGFVPADGSDAGHEENAGAKGRNLDQLVSDAKKQLGDNPQ
ncbi:MAG: hypothetical protein QM753_14510 [Thermomicrobiales bacterium]